VDVVVDGRRCKALCDTGANISLARPSVFANTVSLPPVRILGIGGFIVLAAGNILNFTIDGCSYSHHVYSYDACPSAILLGTDFLNGRAVIDFTVSPPSVTFNHCKDVNGSYEEFKRFILRNQGGLTFADVMARVNSSDGILESDSVLGLSDAMIKCLSTISDPDLRKVLKFFMLKWTLRDKSDLGVWKGSILPPHKVVLKDKNYVACNKVPWVRWSKKEWDFMVSKNNSNLSRGLAMKEPLDKPSPWNSPQVCADKPQPAKDPYRSAVNYYQVNQKIISPRCAMPLIDDVVRNCNGDLFLHVDIEDGYFNIRLHRDSWPITATTCPVNGRIWMLFMQPGMTGCSEAFQVRMDDLFMLV